MHHKRNPSISRFSSPRACHCAPVACLPVSVNFFGCRRSFRPKELDRMTAIIKQRRILLKEWFVAEDPRREEVVTQVCSGGDTRLRVTKAPPERSVS